MAYMEQLRCDLCSKSFHGIRNSDWSHKEFCGDCQSAKNKKEEREFWVAREKMDLLDRVRELEERVIRNPPEPMYVPPPRF